MVRLVSTAAGALTVDLVSGDTIAVTVGTISAGTINSGTINAGTINSGTINVLQLGTVVGNWTNYQGTIQIPTSDSVTTGTAASTISGLIYGVTLKTPDMEDTDSTKIQLIDALGGTLLDSGTQAESTNIFYGTTRPVNTSMNWVVTAQGTQSANRDIIFAVHYEK